MMAIVKLPRQRMYWSQHTRIPPIADIISVKRFEKIKKYIHFCDNNKALPKTHPEFDKLFKIRPVLESVVSHCRPTAAEEKLSIDEQIISTKGRSSLKQYLLKKSNKWGMKVCARCGISGIIYDFEVYTEKYDKNETDNCKLLMDGNILHRFTRTLEKDKNYKVYFDNIVSSINLMLKLKEERF